MGSKQNTHRGGGLAKAVEAAELELAQRKADESPPIKASSPCRDGLRSMHTKT